MSTLTFRALLGTAPADLIDHDNQTESTTDEARARAERIRAGMVVYIHTQHDIADAYARRDWQALGYDTWAAYLEAEFEITRLRLSVDERREAVEAYRMTGMSTRAIAAAVGASEATVRRDLPAASNDAPAAVTGTDNKTYAASRPEPPAATEPESAPAYPIVTVRTLDGDLVQAEPEPGSGSCEKCGAYLPPVEVRDGYTRCGECDDNGDHYLRPGTDICVGCHPGPGDPRPVPAPVVDPLPAGIAAADAYTLITRVHDAIEATA